MPIADATVGYRAGRFWGLDLALFTSLAEQSFTRLAVSGRDFHTAARYADQYTAGLRAGDALHLAITANHGARIITLDKGLAKAADKLGVSNNLL